MALAFSDGFSLYDTSAGAVLIKGWSNAFSSYMQYRQPGRWGSDSYSLFIDQTGASRSFISKTLTLSGSTTILGVAISLDSTSFTNGGRFITLTNGAATVALTWVTGNRIAITNGSSTTYFTTPSGIAVDTWYYLELKITWNASAGQIIYRMDTSQYYDSGASLGLGSSANATSLMLGSTAVSSESIITTYTDLILMDGSGTSLNDFQGDVRIETLIPSASGTHNSWSQTNNTLLTSANQARFTTDTSGWATLAGSPGLSRIATGGPRKTIPSYATISGTSARIINSPNGTSGYPVAPGDSLRVGAYNRNGTLNIYLRFYDSGGATVGSDLSAGSLSWGGSWAWFQSSSVTVPASAATCAIIIESTSSTVRNFTGVTLSSTDISTISYTDPTGSHHFSVSDPTYDNDTSYVSTSGVGSKDTYNLDNLQSTVGTVLGVRTYAVARKESASVHTVTPVTRVSGVDHPGTVVNLPDNLTYQAMSDFYPTNPVSGSPWTRTDVNNMEAGIDLSS